MFRISRQKKLAENEFEFWVEAPRIAEKAQPGQFVILKKDEAAERIPLTIVDTDLEAGTVKVIFQVVGRSTVLLSELKEGDYLSDIVGPLGKPTEIENYGTVLLVGGGVGIAVLLPIIKGLSLAGNRVISVLGAKTDELVILRDEVEELSDELIIMTDDGSLGRKGLVTEAMVDVFEREKIDYCWAIGPSMMMKFATLTAQKYEVPMFVSLNPIMIDGTGMCGCCRITVNNEIKFACVDGPEFNAYDVDWDEFVQRSRQYREEETLSLEQLGR